MKTDLLALAALHEERRKVREADKAAEEEFVKNNTEYAELVSLRDKLGLELVRAKISRKSPEEISKLENELHAAEEKIKAISPKKHYYCDVCKDEGDENCVCYKKIFTETLNRGKLSFVESTDFEDFRISFYPDVVNEKKYGISVSPKQHMAEVLDYCKKYAAKVPSKELRNMVLIGNSGLGKSFACSCITNAVIERGIPVIYIKSSELFDEITFKGNEKLQEAVENIPLLIIDDLGAEKQTEMRYSDLLDLLDRRQVIHKEKGYGTVFTTNLTPKELNTYYGERVCSRLFGDYELIRFIGDDIRLQ